MPREDSPIIGDSDDSDSDSSASSGSSASSSDSSSSSSIGQKPARRHTAFSDDDGDSQPTAPGAAGAAAAHVEMSSSTSSSESLSATVTKSDRPPDGRAQEPHPAPEPGTPAAASASGGLQLGAGRGSGARRRSSAADSGVQRVAQSPPLIGSPSVQDEARQAAAAAADRAAPAPQPEGAPAPSTPRDAEQESSEFSSSLSAAEEGSPSEVKQPGPPPDAAGGGEVEEVVPAATAAAASGSGGELPPCAAESPGGAFALSPPTPAATILPAAASSPAPEPAPPPAVAASAVPAPATRSGGQSSATGRGAGRGRLHPPAAVPAPSAAPAPTAAAAPAPPPAAAAARGGARSPRGGGSAAAARRPGGAAAVPSATKRLPVPVRLTKAQRLRRAASAGGREAPPPERPSSAPRAQPRSRTAAAPQPQPQAQPQPQPEPQQPQPQQPQPQPPPAQPEPQSQPGNGEPGARWGLAFAPRSSPPQERRHTSGTSPIRMPRPHSSRSCQLASPDTGATVVSGARQQTRARISHSADAAGGAVSPVRMHAARLRAAFVALDAAGGGVVSRQDVVRALRKDAEVRRLLHTAGFSPSDAPGDPMLQAVFPGGEGDVRRDVTSAVFEAELLRVLRSVSPVPSAARRTDPVLQDSIREREQARGEKQSLLADLESFLSMYASASPRSRRGDDPVISDAYAPPAFGSPHRMDDWECRRVLGKALHSHAATAAAPEGSSAPAAPAASSGEDSAGAAEAGASQPPPSQQALSRPEPQDPPQTAQPQRPTPETWREAQRRYLAAVAEGAAAAGACAAPAQPTSRLFEVAKERMQQKEKWADIERAKRDLDGEKELTFAPQLNARSRQLDAQVQRVRDTRTRLPQKQQSEGARSGPAHPSPQRDSAPPPLAFGSRVPPRDTAGSSSPPLRRSVANRSGSADAALPQRLNELARPRRQQALELDIIKSALAGVQAELRHRPQDPKWLRRREEVRAQQPDLWTALYKDSEEILKKRKKDAADRLRGQRASAQVGLYFTDTSRDMATRRRRARLTQLFHLLDVHGRGTVSQQEVSNALSALHGAGRQGITKDPREVAVLRALAEAAEHLKAAGSAEFSLQRFLDVIEPQMGRRGPVEFLAPAARTSDPEPAPSFAPELNHNTQKLLGRRDTDGPSNAHERLYRGASEQHQKRAAERERHQAEQLSAYSFRPQINSSPSPAARRSNSAPTPSPGGRIGCSEAQPLWRSAAARALAGVSHTPPQWAGGRWDCEGRPLDAEGRQQRQGDRSAAAGSPELRDVCVSGWRRLVCLLPPSQNREETQCHIGDLDGCSVVCLGAAASYRVERCTDCDLILGVCAGSVSVHDCAGVCLTAASQRLRIRRCSDIECFVHCTQAPRVDASSGVVLRPFNAAMPGLQNAWLRCGLIGSRNAVSEVSGGEGWAVPAGARVTAVREVAPPGHGAPQWPPDPVVDAPQAAVAANGGRGSRRRRRSKHVDRRPPSLPPEEDILAALDALGGLGVLTPPRSSRPRQRPSHPVVPDDGLGPDSDDWLQRCEAELGCSSTDSLGAAAAPLPGDDVLHQIDALVNDTAGWMQEYGARVPLRAR
eukprot:TRINITY_DN5165_c0_g1_i2.p1 TRINITY_DN5165_c0_g1~~TRINITY_DN5165_c0_g1_i2.p1  ORF type:complete len:1606 (+),score=218.73 TRINITY_DN5165_c0_g1_i2:68-4819(+)